MKKRILSVLASVCAVTVIAFSAVGCAGKTGRKVSVDDAYGLGAVTTVKLLGTGMSAEAMSAFVGLGNEAVSVTTATENGTDERKDATEKFNEYFRALDGFTGKDALKTEVSDNDDEKYPYGKKMTIEGIGTNGRKAVYVMYYDETEVKTEEDDGEVEKEYSLTGVITIDGKEYAVEGERGEETEADEKENELRIRAYADITDKTTYVEMEQETSEEDGETETEYVYSVYRGGELIERTAVEFEKETENGNEEVAYELEFRTGGAKVKYEVERKGENGEIKVKFAENGKRGEFTVKATTDENGNEAYKYVFPDGEEYVFATESREQTING